MRRRGSEARRPVGCEYDGWCILAGLPTKSCPGGRGQGSRKMDGIVGRLINSLAEGRTETPQTRKMPAPTGPGGGRIAIKKGHQTRSKKPGRRTLQITTGRVAGRRASFSGGCCISGNSRTPHGPKYEARLVRPRAPRPARAPCVRWPHGGAVILAVGRVAFVSCATPIRSKNESSVCELP